MATTKKTTTKKGSTSKSNTSIKNDLSAYATYVNNVDTTYTFDKFASMTIAESIKVAYKRT